MSTKTNEDRSDTELLQAYWRDGDEAAFEVLARRHVDMLFAVSLRRSGSRQLAEEATQNVLLSLSRKARKLSGKEKNLAGWLHKGTRFELAKLQRRESRIKAREQAYAQSDMNTSDQGEDEAFQRLYPVLDRAIDHLGAADREVIVRRYLEGQNFRRIGTALGISEDAAQKRSSRAFEKLNHFFKRRAGGTVSSAGLVAGINKYTTEPAPAACLDLAGKSLPTGLSSVFPVMSPGKIIGIATGAVILAGAGIIFVNRDKGPTEADSTPSREASDPQASRPNERSTAADPGAGSEDRVLHSGGGELSGRAAVSPHPDNEEFTRRLSVKHDRLLRDLTENLGLSAPQAESLKKLLDERINLFRTALDAGSEPGDPVVREQAMIADAGGIIRGAGLREELQGLVSDRQLALFDVREAKGWQTQVEAHAYRELAELMPVLSLTEEQKVRVLELLKASSAEKLAESADIRAFMAMQKGQSPSQMQLTDLEEAKFLYESLDKGAGVDPNSAEFKEQMKELVGGRIRRKVGLLAPVLDERQRQRYREHLVQKSPLPQFGIEFSAPERQ